MKPEELINLLERDFTPPMLTQKEVEFILKRDGYHDFITNYNGGFFLKNSLHIYGLSPQYTFHDFQFVNKLFQREYGSLVSGLFFFAEDLFGNQFAFDVIGIVFFNVESSERKVIATDFLDWLNVIEKDLNYYTGNTLVPEEYVFKLAWGNRLCPKVPFILGGEYNQSNLVLKNFTDNIGFNASIAKQVYNLPEGTKFKIKVKK